MESEDMVGGFSDEPLFLQQKPLKQAKNVFVLMIAAVLDKTKALS